MLVINIVSVEMDCINGDRWYKKFGLQLLPYIDRMHYY